MKSFYDIGANVLYIMEWEWICLKPEEIIKITKNETFKSNKCIWMVASNEVLGFNCSVEETIENIKNIIAMKEII